MAYTGNPYFVANYVVDRITGTGNASYSLSVAPFSVNTILVTINNTLRDTNTYTVNGTTITFASPVPAIGEQIVVRHLSYPGTAYTPGEGSVQNSALAGSFLLPPNQGGTGATTLTGYVYGNGTGTMTASTTIPNSATTATSANTNSAIVSRDASGNFSAGAITATSFSGSGAGLTNIPNGALTNSSVTINTATGLSGGGTISLGGALTLTPAVASLVAGNAISLTNNSGAWTIASTYTPPTSPQFTALGVGTPASGTTGEIRATNNITAYYSSDAKFKENVRVIDGAIDKVTAIGGKYFDWTDTYIAEHGGEDGYFIQKSDFGVIAQDVQAVFPQAVRSRPDGSLAVDYKKLSALAFAAIAELTKRVEVLEAK